MSSCATKLIFNLIMFSLTLFGLALFFRVPTLYMYRAYVYFSGISSRVVAEIKKRGGDCQKMT